MAAPQGEAVWESPKGLFTCVTGTSIPVSPAAAIHIGTDSGLVDLSCLAPTYIASAIPTDPTGGDAGDTEYTIQQDTAANGSRFIVCAPLHAETAIVPTPSAYCLTR